MACNDKNKCVSPVSSSCVMYTGTKLLSVDESKLKCGITVTDVIETMDVELNLLQKSLSNKTLVKKCFEFDKDKVQQHELNQMFINKICEHDGKIGGTNGNVNYNDIVSNAIIDVNCGLTNCDGVNTKKLSELLKILCNEIVSLKSKLNTIQSSGTSNSSLYIPNV